MVDVDRLWSLPGAYPGIWSQWWIQNFQRGGLCGQNSSLGFIWCQWKRLWSQGHKVSEKEQIEGHFWMLRLSEFRILKDKNWWPQRVLRLHCDFFQGQITQILFHAQENVGQNMGVQVTPWGWGNSIHTVLRPHRVFPELSPLPDFTSEKKTILGGSIHSLY